MAPDMDALVEQVTQLLEQVESDSPDIRRDGVEKLAELVNMADDPRVSISFNLS